jgi:hypothetical protein
MKIAPPAERNITPDPAKWEHDMRSASEGDAANLREHAILSLNQTQAWGPLIGSRNAS